jgi:hypothetical protein
MSALPPKADIRCRDRHVRFVPKADIYSAKRYVRFTTESGHSAPRLACFGLIANIADVCATSARPSQAKLFDVGLIPSNKGGLFPLTF